MASNFFNKASLIMVPDAPIDGKLPSVKPEDRSGDFTFSRGSNLAATRVNKGGLIEKGRENLLLQSNQFDTTWTTARLSGLTSGQSGYDGSSDAWSVIPNTANDDHKIYQSISQTGVVTFSVYAKANGYNGLALVSSNTNNGKFFNLSNGTLGNDFNSSPIDSTITEVSNGWYRCEVVFNVSAGNFFTIYVSSDGISTHSFSGNGTNGIYIQDAQLEYGLVATDYIETTTATVQKGILENLPRIDYSGGALCPSLLLEPQRTNRILFSEWFGAWDSFSTFLTHKDGISPSGYKDATKLYIPADNANVYIRTQFSNVANQTHIGSIFLKKVDGDEVRLRLSGSAPNIEASAIFNLSNGTYRDAVGSVTPSIENYGNGWYRCSIGDLGGATVATPSFRIDALGTGYAPTVYVWGAQVELGSYPTSYIPTYGSSVTRSADSGVSDVDSLLTSNATYTWMAEFIVPEIGNGGGEITFKDAGGLSQLRIYCNQNSMVGLRVDENSQNYYIPVSVGDTAKCLFQCTNGLVKGFYNGALVKTFTIDTGMDAQKIHLGPPVSAPKVKQIALFGTALTDDECIALTTI